MITPNDLRHGTVNGYVNLKCRCDACRQAWRDYPNRRAAVTRYRKALYAAGLTARGTKRIVREVTP